MEKKDFTYWSSKEGLHQVFDWACSPELTDELIAFKMGIPFAVFLGYQEGSVELANAVQQGRQWWRDTANFIVEMSGKGCKAADVLLEKHPEIRTSASD